MTQRRIARTLRPLAEKVRETYSAGREGVRYSYDAAGNVEQSFVYGGTDGLGYAKAGNRDRCAMAYTAEHVKKARSVLKGAGVALSLEEAEGALQMALASYDGAVTLPEDESAGRVKRFRKRAIANGLCLVCGREPKREGRKTCAQCSFNAACRVARSREARKAAA